jgi:hypothetical protein
MRSRTNQRATLAVVVVCALAWCLLLFGIGLDDLTNRHTEPGLIFAVITLALAIAALLYALYRLAIPSLRRHHGKPS